MVNLMSNLQWDPLSYGNGYTFVCSYIVVHCGCGDLCGGYVYERTLLFINKHYSP